jgi:gas vesicle protein
MVDLDLAWLVEGDDGRHPESSDSGRGVHSEVDSTSQGSTTMGFMSGVVTGLAIAGAAAAWYMSRSGERFREEYKVERRLGELGDQLEARTREIQATVNAQLADLRAKADELELGANGHDAKEALDAAQAGAAEKAAEADAAAETTIAKVRKSTKDAAEDVTEG